MTNKCYVGLMNVLLTQQRNLIGQMKGKAEYEAFKHYQAIGEKIKMLERWRDCNVKNFRLYWRAYLPSILQAKNLTIQSTDDLNRLQWRMNLRTVLPLLFLLFFVSCAPSNHPTTPNAFQVSIPFPYSSAKAREIKKYKAKTSHRLMKYDSLPHQYSTNNHSHNRRNQ